MKSSIEVPPKGAVIICHGGDPTSTAPRCWTEQCLRACSDIPDVECLVVFDHVEPTLENRRCRPPQGRRCDEHARPRLAGNRNPATSRTGSCSQVVMTTTMLPGKLTAQSGFCRRTGASVSPAGSSFTSGSRHPSHPSLGDASRGLPQASPSRGVPVLHLMRRREVLDTIGLVDERIPAAMARTTMDLSRNPSGTGYLRSAAIGARLLA